MLKYFTGSDYFGFSTVLPPNFGRVEPGVPLVPTTFSYPTFKAAADEAGVSRRLGGIHFVDDDVNGRVLGAWIGYMAWQKAKSYFNDDDDD